MVWDTVKKRGRHPYRGFNIFIYGRQGICALERSHPRSDEEILILYRMALQLYGVREVKVLFRPRDLGPRRTGYGGGRSLLSI
jgi:hypothetical protein